MNPNRITSLFHIKYPLIQAGMIWASGWKLASAVSQAGGLGILGAGSMYPDILRTHIKKCQQATHNPFAVNVPLLYPDIEEIMQIIVESGVKIVFTSAGNPKTWTSFLKEHGITVVHVAGSVKFASKSEQAGVDAVVVEGFEAGGHNSREETTTFTLIPMVKEKVQIPIIAAGGIATGKSMLAAMILGADAVQMGTRFVMSNEASSHQNFKEYIQKSGDGDTILTLKEIVPVRMLKNEFYEEVMKLYAQKPGKEELQQLLGRARPKKGMFLGDLKEGELQIGQISGLIDDIKPAAQIVHDIIAEFKQAQQAVNQLAL